eukprot:3963591-Pleurochrysis_carterae.AAC.4
MMRSCHDIHLADSFGALIHPATAKDEFDISWLGVFNAQGRVVDSVVGSWVPRCKHLDARGRVHAWKQASASHTLSLLPSSLLFSTCLVTALLSLLLWETCCTAPHGKQCDKVKREAILMYNVELTNISRVSMESKQQICKALEPHPAAVQLLPSTWRSNSPASRRRAARRR